MMVTFKRDYEVDLTNWYGFTFKKGYSYMSYPIKHGIEVTSIDGKVRIKLDVDGIEKYLKE